MKFMLLVYTDESADPAPGEPGFDELWDAYVALDDAAREAGVLIDSQPFEPTAAAVTVEVRAGVTSTREGPAECTARQLGGYYLLELPSLQDAIEWAARIRGAGAGAVEIRRIAEAPPGG